MEIAITLLAVLIGLSVGAGAGYYGRRLVSGGRVDDAQLEADRIVESAQEQRRTMVIEAKEQELKLHSEWEGEVKQQRSEFSRVERRLSNRDENLEKRSNNLDRRERGIANKERRAEKIEEEIEDVKQQALAKLEELSDLSMSEAKDILMKEAEDEIQHEIARRYRDFEEQAREDAQEVSSRILATAIHRMASDVVSEMTVTTVPLPSDDMKGRLIGREGRNIRAIEKSTGVDLIIDDTPEAVTLSCFDPVRREIARIAVTKLIADGRIHPARIEEMVQRAEKDVENSIWKAGEEAVFDTDVRGLNPEIVRLLGRLKYRYSYGENVLQHSLEVSHIAGMLASEIGANIKTAKIGGLLHDIGKALTHEVEGPHADIGAEGREQIQRCQAGLRLHSRASRRRDELAGVVYRSGGRRYQRGEAGRSQRHRRELHEAVEGAGRGRRRLRRCREMLRHPGRPRGPRDGQTGLDRRRYGRPDGARDRQEDRRQPCIPGSDQGHGDPGEPQRRVREVES